MFSGDTVCSLLERLSAAHRSLTAFITCDLARESWEGCEALSLPVKSTPPALEAGGFHGQGSTCDPGDLLSALLPTLAGLLGWSDRGPGEKAMMPEGQEQSSTTTQTVGQKG